MKVISRNFAVDESVRGVAGPRGMMKMLPPAEYRMLLAIAGGKGSPVSHSGLSRLVWKVRVSTSAVKRLVHRLRKRIGAEHIECVRGIGYRLVD